MVDPLIELKDIVFSYDSGRTVLDGASLQLRPGERVGVTGANGSGKTTLLHLVVGLLKPQAGTVHAFGRERRDENNFQEVRARAGLVFQDPEDQLFCPTVAEDVAFGPFNLGWERERVPSGLLRAEVSEGRRPQPSDRWRSCTELSGSPRAADGRSGTQYRPRRPSLCEPVQV